MSDQEEKQRLAQRLGGFQELLTWLGIGLVGGGCYLISLPLALIVVGGLFLFFALWPAVYRLLVYRWSKPE